MRKTTLLVLFVCAAFLLTVSLAASSPTKKWEYAQLTKDKSLRAWVLQWDRPAVMQYLSDPADSDKILIALGGKPYVTGVEGSGSGWFPLLLAMGKLGWELVAVDTSPEGEVNYVFKREL